MVGSYVHQHADVSPEIIHIVELERAYLQDIPLMVAFSHLQCIASSYVASESYVQSCLLHDVIDECRSGRFSVASRDADGLSLAVS